MCNCMGTREAHPRASPKARDQGRLETMLQRPGSPREGCPYPLPSCLVLLNWLLGSPHSIFSGLEGPRASPVWVLWSLWHCPHDPWASPRCPEFLRCTELPLAGQALSFPELLLQVALAVTSSTRATPPPAFPPHQPGLCPSLPPPSPSGEPAAPLHQHSRDPPFHPRLSHVSMPMPPKCLSRPHLSSVPWTCVDTCRHP